MPPLLERTTRRHTLNEIGSVYLERCREPRDHGFVPHRVTSKAHP